MLFGVIFFNLSIISLYFSLILNKKIFVTFPSAIIFIMLLEYIGGLLFDFTKANILIIIISAFCAIKLITKRNNLSKYIDSSIILNLIFYIVSIIILKNKTVVSHNELWTWALIIKTFFIDNDLLKFGTSVVNAGYMPGNGLFCYWFLSHFKNYSDGLVFISNALVHYSLVIACSYFIKSKVRFFYSIIIVLFLSIVSNLIYFYLYVEPLLALYFVLMLLFYINSAKTKKNSIIFMLFTIGLALSKSTAVLFFSAFIISIFLVTKKAKIKFLLPALFSFLFINISYSMYLNINNLNTSWDLYGINITNVIDFFMGKAEAYKYTVFNVYLDCFFKVKESVVYFLKIKIPPIIYLFISLCYLFLVNLIKRKYKLKFIFISVFNINIIYIISLLLMYIFCFDKWESLCLSAFSRYIQVLNIINILACLYVFFSYKIRNLRTINFIKVILLLLLIYLCNNQYLCYKREINKIKKINSLNKEYIDIRKHKHIFKENDKLLVITSKIKDINGEREIAVYKIRYKFAPLNVNMMDKTIVSQEEISDKLLCGYTYIYFDESDDDVINQYKFLSKKIMKNVLYKINKINNNFYITDIINEKEN